MNFTHKEMWHTVKVDRANTRSSDDDKMMNDSSQIIYAIALEPTFSSRLNKLYIPKKLQTKSNLTTNYNTTHRHWSA
jgi:hypothetical protein